MIKINPNPKHLCGINVPPPNREIKHSAPSGKMPEDGKELTYGSKAVMINAISPVYNAAFT